MEKVIQDWIKYGGVVNYLNGLYLMDEGEFLDWCHDHGKDPKDENTARDLCRQALLNANVDKERIEELMKW